MAVTFRNARTTSHSDTAPRVICDILIQNTGWQKNFTGSPENSARPVTTFRTSPAQSMADNRGNSVNGTARTNPRLWLQIIVTVPVTTAMPTAWQDSTVGYPQMDPATQDPRALSCNRIRKFMNIRAE